MSKQIDILDVLTDKKKLKEISLDKLIELEEKYPYSSVLDVLINKKQLKISGNLSLLQMVNLVSKTDNPGLAFTSVVEGTNRKEVKEESPKKNKKTDSEVKKKKKKSKSKHSKKDIGLLGKGIVSEKLAEIYLKQGMKKEAIEMYKALSLQNPEKSAYFAKILKKIKK